MSTLALSTVSRPRRPAPLTAAATMAGRNIRLSRRNVEALITAVALPVILMLLFVYLFGGAIQTGTRYVTYVVPGVLLLCASFGASTTAVSVAQDMTSGTVDRLRSMDVGGTSVVFGHVVASIARNVLATVLTLGVAFAIGFRPSAGLGGWLAASGILLLFLVALSWVAALLGLLAGSAEAAGGLTFGLTFLPYPSSAFVPVDTMPGWLQGFARHQPFTTVTESLRGSLLDRPVGSYGVQAIAWSVGIIAVSMLLAAVLFRRKTGR